MSGMKKAPFIVLIMFCTICSVSHAVFTWNGTTDNAWTTGTNWVGGIAPGADVSDSLAFGVDAGDYTVTGAGGINVAGIDFNAAGNSYSVTGTSFSLDSAGTIGGTSGFAHTMNVGLVSTGPGGIDFNGTDDFTIGGIISGAGGITMSGTGTLTLSGVNTYTGGTTVSAGTLAGTTSSLQGDILNNAALTFDQAGNGTFSDIISGTGSLTKSGAGNMTLSGANTYSGGTTVSVGTLTGTTTSLQGNIVNNAALVFDQAADGTYSGIMSGTGTLTKSSAGSLTLSGINTYTGTTTLSAGTMNLTGQLAGDVIVNGGTFMGTGTIGGGGDLTVNAGANFAPGASIGTTTVTGDYVQAAGSTLEVEIFKAAGGALSNDQVDVTGTATLNAGSAIEVTDLTPADRFIVTGDTFDIITTTGGVVDNTPTITSLSASLSFTGGVVGNDYILTASRAAFSSNAGTRNNQAVLDAIDADTATAAGDMVTIINELSALNAAELNAAAEQMIPLPHGSAAAFANTMTTALTTNTTSYLSGRRSGALNIARYGAPLGQESFLAQGPETNQQVVRDAKAVTPSVHDQSQNKYVTPFGMYFDQDSTKEFTGFNAWSTGVTFGFDDVLNDNWIVGWGGSYMHSWMDYDSSFGDGEIDSFRTGPYASFFDGDYYVDIALGVGYHLNEIERDIVFGGIDRTADSDYDSYEFSAYLGGGYDFLLDNNWTLTPTASMQYLSYRNKSFKETGAGAAGLDVDANTQESFLTKIGFNFRTVTELDSIIIAPELFAGYAHEFIDEEDYNSTLIGGATKFSTRIDSERDDIFYFGGNLTGSLNENTSVFIRYEGEVYSSNKTHILTGGFTFLF